jgi:hypothetical protein
MVAPDPVPAALLDLLALFEGPLNSVHFPDVDRAVLAELADAVRASAEDVERAGAALLAAKAALDDRREALVRMSQRALAYARVYAEDDAELRARLDTITMPKTRGPAKPPPARAPEASSSPEQNTGRQAGDVETTGTEVVEAPAPRRRGRPPKVKLEPVPAPEAAPEETITPAAPAEAEETLAAE